MDTGGLTTEAMVAIPPGRSAADRRIIATVFSLLAALVTLASFVETTAAEPPSVSDPTPATASHEAVTGSVTIKLLDNGFIVTEGADLLGCSEGPLSGRDADDETYTLRCRDGSRTGAIDVRLRPAGGAGPTWTIEDATEGYRMLSGSGTVSASGDRLTGHIQYGQVDHVAAALIDFGACCYYNDFPDW